MSAAILATILFSLSAVSGKRLSHYLTAIEANMIRFIISALLLGLYSSYYGIGLGGGAFGMFFISGIIGFVALAIFFMGCGAIFLSRFCK